MFGDWNYINNVSAGLNRGELIAFVKLFAVSGRVNRENWPHGFMHSGFTIQLYIYRSKNYWFSIVPQTLRINVASCLC